MTVVLTGATGYLGHEFKSRWLETEEQDILTLSRLQKGLLTVFSVRNEAVSWKGRWEDLGAFFRDVGVTSVINLAGSVVKDTSHDSIDSLISGNIQFTTHLAQSAREGKVQRFIHASTFSTESHFGEYKPQTLYAATKRSSESILEFFSSANDVNFIILNFYDIYGPRQRHERIIKLLFESLMEGKQVSISAGNQEICPLYVDDAISALNHSLEVPLESSLSHWAVPGPELFLVKDLPDLAAKYLGKKWKEGQLDRNFVDNRQIIFRMPFTKPTIPEWEARFKLRNGLLHMQTAADALSQNRKMN